MPILVALLCIPYIVRGLGVERFGILSLAWSLLGYFSYLDLGVTRATIRFTADAIGRGSVAEIPGTVWTSFVMQGVFGLTGAGLLVASVPELVTLFRIPSQFVQESRAMFYALAVALPIVLCLGNAKGVLEAAQRFDLVNMVRVSSSSFMFLAPAIGVALGYRLSQIIALLVAILAATAVAYVLLSMWTFPSLRTRVVVLWSAIWPLLRYGRWVMISSILVPIIVYSDRLFIALTGSVAAVGFYAGPYEIAARLQVIPWSFVTTLFPAFSTVIAEERQDPRSLYARSFKYLLLVMGPVAIMIVVFAHEILSFWLGPEYAEKGTRVLQFLAVGMVLNALSQIPASALDAIGRPDLRAKTFIAYLLPYLLLLWLLIHSLGIVGAAVAWMIRGAWEMAIFFAVARRSLHLTMQVLARHRLHLTFTAVALLAMATAGCAGLLTGAWWSRGAAIGALFAVFAVFVWRYVLDDSDRGVQMRLAALIRSRGSE